MVPGRQGKEGKGALDGVHGLRVDRFMFEVVWLRGDYVV